MRAYRSASRSTQMSCLKKLSNMKDVWFDDVGRSFCALHRRDFCDECCLSSVEINRYLEEQVGLRRPPTPAETLASEKVMLERGIKFMLMQKNRRPCQENLDFHRTELRRVEAELDKLRQQQPGVQHEIQQALDKAYIKAASEDADLHATTAALARMNPGVTELQVGGVEYQRVYEQFVAPPPSANRDQSVDPYTCSFCGTHSTTKMACCGRCKKQAYCSKKCQVGCCSLDWSIISSNRGDLALSYGRLISLHMSTVHSLESPQSGVQACGSVGPQRRKVIASYVGTARNFWHCHWSED